MSGLCLFTPPALFWSKVVFLYFNSFSDKIDSILMKLGQNVCKKF